MKVRHITDTGEDAWIWEVKNYTVRFLDRYAYADVNAVDYL
jgi:hypothetical protein